MKCPANHFICFIRAIDFGFYRDRFAIRMAEDIEKMTQSGQMKVAFAHSVPFLEAMGDVIIGWMHLWRAVITAPKIEGAKKRIELFIPVRSQQRRFS